jgi:hypothetical protein
MICGILFLFMRACKIETFAEINMFGDDYERRMNKKYDDYLFAKDNLSTLMPSSGKSVGDVKAIALKKVDCSKCSWKMDNFCKTTDANGNIVYDEKCDKMEHVDVFGTRHVSKGYMCSAYGSDLGFEECNDRKCKQDTMNGCLVTDLPRLTRNVKIDTINYSGRD